MRKHGLNVRELRQSSPKPPARLRYSAAHKGLKCNYHNHSTARIATLLAQSPCKAPSSADVKRDLGKDLSELAILMCFLISRASSAAARLVE